jgi:chaperonin GroES
MLDALAQQPDAAPEGEPAPDNGALANNTAALHTHRKIIQWIAAKNICDYLDDQELDKIGIRAKREYDIDENSRSDWKEKTSQAMELAMQVAKEKSYPWPKAANVIWPLMTTAALQFNARAYPAIVSGRDVVKGVVIGQDDGTPAMQNGQPVMDPQTQQPVWQVPPGAKRIKADKIAEHMSWQLTDEQEEWEPETDALLIILPIAGCVFRKSYFDPSLGRNRSLMVSAMKLVINYTAKSMETTPRITEEVEFYPLEIKSMERSGMWREIAYTQAPNQDGDDDAPVEFLEQHRWLDLDEDDFPEPYIVTVHKETSKVVRIVSRYEADGIKLNAKGDIKKIDPVHYYTKYDFVPNPEGGIYGVGFGQLLKPMNEAINTTLNMMIDAGHLANVGGGFIGKGLSMNSGAIRFQPGEYKMVNATGASVRESIVPIPAPGPSPVLFQLLGMLVEAGKDIASVKDIVDQPQANTPATTILAMIEQGLKVFTAIYKRVHRSLKQEYAKLYRLNRIYLDQDTTFRRGDEWKSISRQDYAEGSGVEPISDPTMVSDMQKLGRAQFLLQFRQDELVDGKEILTRAFDAASIPNTDSLFAKQPKPNPKFIIEAGKLDLEHQKVAQDNERGARKQAHEEAALELRARHDAALMVKEEAAALLARAQALNQLAQAAAASGSHDLGWAQHDLEIIRTQLQALETQATMGTAAESAPSTITPGTPEAASQNSQGMQPPSASSPQQAGMAPPANAMPVPVPVASGPSGGGLPGLPGAPQ